MKRFPFLQVAFMVALMVTIVSCTLPREASGGYYEDDGPARRNAYYGNPYYGNDVIIVERDPYTGRYYQVSPYGAYSSPYGVYSSPYNSRRYRGDNYYSTPRQNRQSQEQRAEGQRRINEAKESILGKKRD